MRFKKLIIKIDLGEYEMDEFTNYLEQNYNFKILDEEVYEDER